MVKKLSLLLAAAVGLSAAAPAMAVDVGSGSVQLNGDSASQLGRLTRNGLQQDWSGTEAFPGIINPGTTYSYTSVALPFAPNASQTVYYEIIFDDEETDLFASAYLDRYDPTDKASNWLGDAGSSGNYFPGDARFFDVVVPMGHTLQLVVNSSIAGKTATSTANYLVTAFSSTEYDENFAVAAPAPEPDAWAMMIVGFGLMGASLRRRRQKVGVRFA